MHCLYNYTATPTQPKLMLIDDLSSLIVIIVFLVLGLLWSVLKAVFTKWCAAAKVHLYGENARKRVHLHVENATKNISIIYDEYINDINYK